MDGQFHAIEFDPSATADEVLKLVKSKIGLRENAQGNNLQCKNETNARNRGFWALTCKCFSLFLTLKIEKKPAVFNLCDFWAQKRERNGGNET